MKKILLLIFILFLTSCTQQSSQDFCGLSSYANCSSDSECLVGGCSGELCQSVNTEPSVSICEWKDCYENTGQECKCVSNECQWL